MSWSALVYGYAAHADEIIAMPQVESYRDSKGRMVQIDNYEIDAVEWADNHHRYGDYVIVSDEGDIYFGVFVGESGDKLTIEDIEEARKSEKKIAEVVEFFCGERTNSSDYGYFVCTMHNY